MHFSDMSRSMSPASTSSPLITNEQVAAYHDHGYCAVDGLFAEAELAAIEAFFEDYKKRGDAVFDSGQTFAEVDKTKRQVRAMHPHRYSELACSWGLHPKIVEVLEVLFGRPPLLAQTMYYFKPPGSRGQGMHQDNFYLQALPSTCIAAWTPVDDAELENGCLYVAPGSHRSEVFCPESGQAKAWMEYGDSHIRPFPRQFAPVPLPVKRGQTLFFSAQLIHGSGPNRHPVRSRRTFIGHYVDEASAELSKFYHPVLDRDGRAVSHVAAGEGGGPCGDGLGGGIH